jgi:hypothetical protein
LKHNSSCIVELEVIQEDFDYTLRAEIVVFLFYFLYLIPSEGCQDVIKDPVDDQSITRPCSVPEKSENKKKYIPMKSDDLTGQCVLQYKRNFSINGET